MKKDKLNMKLTAGIWALVIILISSPALAQEAGKIYQLSYSPAEPVVFEDTTISIGVENPSDKTQSYLMILQIIKEGQIVYEQEFTFTLEKTKGIFFAPRYSPQDIGKHEVVIKLFDKLGFNLYDTEIIDFNVVSHLGPFDIIIDPLTNRIRPSLLLPTRILLENMGTKGVDVEVKVSVECKENTLSQSITVFVPAKEQVEKLVSMQTCDQEGLYNIESSIILFNKTWVTSSSQFFVNSSYIQLKFDPPEKITLKLGENYTFPVEVTNLGNQKLSDLQFIIQRIPLKWQSTTPSSITQVEPNQTVVFIITINVPQDAEPKPYEIRMTATAEEVLERKISTLEVLPLAVLPATPSAGIPIIRYVLISISSLIGLVLGGTILRKHLKARPHASPPRKERLAVLQKLKEKVKSRQS